MNLKDIQFEYMTLMHYKLQKQLAYWRHAVEQYPYKKHYQYKLQEIEAREHGWALQVESFWDLTVEDKIRILRRLDNKWREEESYSDYMNGLISREFSSSTGDIYDKKRVNAMEQLGVTLDDMRPFIVLYASFEEEFAEEPWGMIDIDAFFYSMTMAVSTTKEEDTMKNQPLIGTIAQLATINQNQMIDKALDIATAHGLTLTEDPDLVNKLVLSSGGDTVYECVYWQDMLLYLRNFKPNKPGVSDESNTQG